MKPHQKNPNLTAVSFATLNADRHSILASLKVRPAQEDWGGTFAASMKEWEQADREFVLGLAFLKGDEPVGIVLLKRKPYSPDWVSEDSVSLHGLKIAESYQGQGFGQAAFGLTIQAAMSRRSQFIGVLGWWTAVPFSKDVSALSIAYD